MSENGTRPMRARTRFALGAALPLLAALALPAQAAQPDPWITTKVKIALLTADGVPSAPVNVDTLDGRVTLYGDVSSEAEKERAEAVARGVEGVSEVRNLLQIAPPEQAPEVPDDALRAQVETVLARDAALSDSDVEVESVNQGVVLLRGDASSLSAHRRALEDARSVEGVRRVASEIQSPDRVGDRELWAADAELAADDGAASALRDGWITTKTKVALMADDAVPALDVNVDTRGGEVTLFGIVPSEAARQAAEAEASRIDGVSRVRNELQVVSETAEPAVAESDDRIEAAVQRRLGEREDLADASIGVAVADGVVRLTGTVDSQADRLTALTVARGTEGVRSALDDLAIRPDVAADR